MKRREAITTTASWAMAFAGLASRNLWAGSNPGREGLTVCSGFAPFDGREKNASWLVAQAVSRHAPGEVRTEAVQVPVLWGAPARVVGQFRSRKPSRWFAFGEGTPGFQIETFARNKRGQHRDSAGDLPPHADVVEEGPAVRRQTFPCAALAERLGAEGFPTAVSSDAGAYLCEEMLYTLLSECAKPDRTVETAVFMHVPILGSPIRDAKGKTLAKMDELVADRFGLAFWKALAPGSCLNGPAPP